MVQMSFRAKAMLIPVTKRDGKRKLARLKAEFGDRLRIVLRGAQARSGHPWPPSG